MKKLRLRRFVFAALLCAVTQPGIARADDIDQLYEQGQAAFEKQSYAEAHTKLSAVWAVRQSYDVATVLSQAEVQLGKHRDAAEHLAYAVAHFPVSAKIELRKQVEAMFADARTQVGTVRLKVTPATASVTVNGRAHGEAERSGPIFVDPGKVTIEVNAPGHVGVRRVLEVAKGGEAEASVTLVAEQAPERSKTPAYVLGGVGVLGLGAGAVLVGLAEAKRSDVDRLSKETGRACPVDGPLTGKCADLGAAASTGDVFGNAGIVALVIGAATGAGAVGYLLLPAPKPERARVSILPIVGGNGGGVLLQGNF